MTHPPKTPLRMALRADSSLQEGVANGMGAVERAHRVYFDRIIRPAIADSLDLDRATRAGHEQENRWDYLLGHAPTTTLVAVEPHSAKEDEVTTIIRKQAVARVQLRGHLRDGVHVTKWLWVASGRVAFADTEKARRRLDENGIEFVGTQVKAKHLPTAAADAVRPVMRRRNRR